MALGALVGPFLIDVATRALKSTYQKRECEGCDECKDDRRKHLKNEPTPIGAAVLIATVLCGAWIFTVVTALDSRIVHLEDDVHTIKTILMGGKVTVETPRRAGPVLVPAASADEAHNKE